MVVGLGIGEKTSLEKFIENVLVLEILIGLRAREVSSYELRYLESLQILQVDTDGLFMISATFKGLFYNGCGKFQSR